MSSISDLEQPVSCPACFAKDPVVAHLDPLDTQNLSVTLPSSGETISFKDATRTYLEEHYPDLHSTTYRVPAALIYECQGNLDLATDEKVLTDMTLTPTSAGVYAEKVAAEKVKDRFQKDAVEKVVQCFHSWGCEHGEGMLILSEYKMQDYLRNVKTGSKNQKTIHGEHDVMVIHLNTAVTFVQVKSVKDTSAWKTMRGKIRSAFEQVAKDEKAFHELNADLDFILTVPVVGFVALPELTHDHLVRMCVCDAHKRRVLTREHLESSSGFNQWVRNFYSEQFQRRGALSLGLENYKELCGRYVGLASVVRIRTMPVAIKKTVAKVGKIMLTPEQIDMIKAGPRLQIIFGESGTGKSLVLAKMAEDIVASDERFTDLSKLVFVVSCTSVSQSQWPTFFVKTCSTGRLLNSPSHLVSHFRNFFPEKMSDSIKIKSIAELFRYCNPDTDPYSQYLSPEMMAQLTRRVISMHPDASVHIMWDEVPFIPGLDWTPLKDLGEKTPGTIWLTITTGTYTTMKSGEPTADIAEKLPSNFVVSRLTMCKRMTVNSFRFYQAFQTYLGDKGCCSTASGNAVNGVVPRWYPLQNCHCGIDNLRCCTCGTYTRLTETLKLIWGLLKDINPSLISIVLRDTYEDQPFDSHALRDGGVDKANRFLMDAVRDACKAAGIPADVHDSQNQRRQSTSAASETVASAPKCHIVRSTSYRGCENSVVIIVSLRGKSLKMGNAGRRHGEDDMLPLISRALGQIFIITSCRDTDNFPTCDEELESYTLTKPDLYEIKLQTRQSRVYFLDYLVEKRVLDKCQRSEINADSPINSTYHHNETVSFKNLGNSTVRVEFLPNSSTT